MCRLPLLAAALALLTATAPVAAQPAAVAGVPTDSLVFVTADVGKLWDKPGFKPLRAWLEAQKAGPSDELFGLGAADIARVTFFVPAAGRDAMPLFLVTTKKPYNEAKVLRALSADEDGGRRGRDRLGNVVALEGGAFRALLFVDEQTLLFLPDGVREGGPGLLALVGQLMAKKADGPLAGALALAGKHDLVMGLDAAPLAELLRVERDREMAPYLALFKARTVTLVADFDKVGTGTMTATFPDAAAARRAAPVLKEGMTALAETLAREEGPRRERVDPLPRFLLESFLTVLKDTTVAADGANVVAKVELPYQDTLAKLAKALPASYGAAVNSRRGMNNLKQLGLAMHNYHDSMGNLPGDVVQGPRGNVAMSWRVQLLPYVEQDNLFRQLDMTKAWDDPANLKKFEAMEMPKVFEIPGRPAPKGHTYFRVFSFPKTAKGGERPMFTEGQKGGSLVAITDGTSNTFMIVEAGEAVPWYKPDVLAYDGKLPLPQLGDKDADGFIVAFADGSVRVMRKKALPERTLRALITASGGEVVNIP